VIGRRQRRVVAVACLGALAGCSGSAGPATSAATAPPPATSAAPSTAAAAGAALARLEQQHGARLGVYAVDTGSGRVVEHRADERFAYASTLKAIAVGVVLQQASPADLDRVVRYTAADLVAHSPVTERHVGSGLTLREVCEAALQVSDNTAMNLLLREVGGPAGLDAALTELGDEVTEVSRVEPELNAARPGDTRDTSTPRALATHLQALALGTALPPEDRELLVGWLRGNTTGDTLVRAGVPAGWVVGDKTGSGGHGTRNDIAVVWPPRRAPLVVAILSTRDTQGAEADDALIASATRIVVEALG
jgi:beta-lactamase class A